MYTPTDPPFPFVNRSPLPSALVNAIVNELVNVATMNGASLSGEGGSVTQVKDAIIAYVQQQVNNKGDFKVRAASSTATNLAAPGATIGGVTMVTGDKFLEKDHATAALRGIYVWNGAAVAATRAPEADDGAELKAGSLIVVTEGTYADQIFELDTDGPIVVGTTPQSYSRKDAGRIRLTANTTFYVSTTGNDSNSGLAVGTPWLTIQKAFDTLLNNYDFAGFTAKIKLANGTYGAGAVARGLFVGAFNGVNGLVIEGDTATPSNVVVSVGGSTCFTAYDGAQFTVSGMRLIGGVCIDAEFGGEIQTGVGIEFGAATIQHIQAGFCGRVILNSNYTILGGAPRHFLASASGAISCAGKTITLTGTPAFSTTFADISKSSVLDYYSNTFSGTATGVRYLINTNGVINTSGGGATYLPGNSAGSAATGGQYV